MKKTRATGLMFFIEILLRIAESECVGAFTCTFRSVLFSRCAQGVDNNLQIYSRQICSRWQRRRARASWKPRHRRGLLFYKLQRGLQRVASLNIHETQPHLVYAPGTDRTFSRRRPV